MRVTKALLEEELKDVRQLMQLTRTENRQLREIIKYTRIILPSLI